MARKALRIAAVATEPSLDATNLDQRDLHVRSVDEQVKLP
jgi:hypothetical protein